MKLTRSPLPLSIRSSQLPNLTKAFKPLRTRLGESAGIDTRPTNPIPMWKRGAGGVSTKPIPHPTPSLPLPFSRPDVANLAAALSKTSDYQRVIGDMELQMKESGIIQTPQGEDIYDLFRDQEEAARAMFEKCLELLKSICDRRTQEDRPLG